VDGRVSAPHKTLFGARTSPNTPQLARGLRADWNGGHMRLPYRIGRFARTSD
jgi:hypothetical protein